ncbi:LuxR family transcriptional regulator [Leptospira fluminis]|uniref:LuxR family transcriptional regulator n=1 Tax=Leptospira fluminis TaxID=2484979 RepID=A0A4R9GL77_9LEPT|nr:LuxR family transcriptional regulator [Leptospira fluminis]
MELKKAKLRIREAEESLRAYKNRLSLPGGKKIGEEFWRSIKLQFYAWGLSPSEEEIAKLMLRGFSNQQIAANLQKSVRTIENQSFSIYKKSGMTGKLEFIAYFIEALLPEEED